MTTENDNKAYMGVDPGKQGGIAVVRGGRVVSWAVMPETDFDLLHCMRTFRVGQDVSFGCLELIHAIQGSSAKGTFTFGEGYGKLQMAFTASQTPYEKVSPRVWQKGLGIPNKKKTESKTDFKERLRAHAQQLFPLLELWNEPRSKTKQMAVCDAILIAEYCRRLREGVL